MRNYRNMPYRRRIKMGDMELVDELTGDLIDCADSISHALNEVLQHLNNMEACCIEDADQVRAILPAIDDGKDLAALLDKWESVNRPYMKAHTALRIYLLEVKKAAMEMGYADFDDVV